MPPAGHPCPISPVSACNDFMPSARSFFSRARRTGPAVFDGPLPLPTSPERDSSGTEAEDPAELPAESGQRQGAERKPEVTQGDVVEVRNEQQVHDDAPEPQGDDV